MNSPGNPIPVVMYHTVGRCIPDWEWSFLTVPADIFNDHLKWLAKSGYTTVDLDELHAHVAGDVTLPAKSVVLTFDDGYLDTWTYVAPLLSRYGFKGTVFVNPEFVDPRDIVRPTLQDVWSGKCRDDQLEIRGFMSWSELRLLARKGPIAIQSHAMTHTWYPASDRIVDFHHPGDGCYWLDWNNFPEKKPFYLTTPLQTDIPWGTPVYENDKSLKVRKFFPDPQESRRVIEFVKDKGGEKFFTTSSWREQLFEIMSEERQSLNKTGEWESEAEQRKRYLYELSESKRIIEERLDITTDFLCWPGGGYNEISREMALEIYRAVTLSSADKTPVRNRPGDDARLIRRIGVPGIDHKGKVVYTGGRYFVRFLDEYRQVMLARFRRQVLKCGYLLGLHFKSQTTQ